MNYLILFCYFLQLHLKNRHFCCLRNYCITITLKCNWICYGMSITEPNTLIPYFTAYIISFFVVILMHHPLSNTLCLQLKS